MCYFDNEEVGSTTKQGADSSFLYDVLSRISMCMGKDSEDFIRACASSFMLSADNAHAVHPNYKEKADPTNRPYMNKGIVIKYMQIKNTQQMQYRHQYLKKYARKQE